MADEIGVGAQRADDGIGLALLHLDLYGGLTSSFQQVLEGGCLFQSAVGFRLTWDAADRLIKMESIAFIQNASPPLVAVNVPAKVIEFAYDGLSRRIRKKVTEGVSTVAV